MSTISFFVPGLPKGQPRARAFAFNGKARVYDPGTAEGWKSCIALAAKPFLLETPWDGPVSAELTFLMPRPKYHFDKHGKLKAGSPKWFIKKPDRDNLDKAVLDALTTLGFWKDDCQVCDGPPRKFYVPEGQKPGLHIKLEQLNQ